jgi:hypothetical protein
MTRKIVRLIEPTTMTGKPTLSSLKFASGREQATMQQEVDQDVNEPEDEKPYVERPVRLKMGAGRFDAACVAATVSMLESMLKYQPEEFKAVRDLALGRITALPPAIAEDYRKAGWLEANGGLTPEVRASFIGSYRNTNEGEVIVDPFAPENAEEVQALRDLNEAQKQFFRGILKGSGYHLRDDDPPSSPRRR